MNLQQATLQITDTEDPGMTNHRPNFYLKRWSLHLILTILLGCNGAYASDVDTTTAPPPRTIADALDRLVQETLTTYGVNDLRLEFIDATYFGVSRRFDAQFRQSGAIFRARIAPDGQIFVTQRQERSQSRAILWQSGPGLGKLPDLDRLLVKAETVVRSEGFQPTGTVLFKFNLTPTSGREKRPSFRSRVFFEITSSDAARVVEFDHHILTSHRSGSLLKISLPKVAPPKITLPELTPLRIELPQISRAALETFRTASNDTLIRIRSDFLFGFDNDQPRPEADALIPALADLLIKGKPSAIAIEGHTDARGTPQYNDNLSLRRAQVIARRLKAAGVTADRFVIRGWGESKPIASEVNADGSDNPTGRQRNRRVEVRFRQ